MSIKKYVILLLILTNVYVSYSQKCLSDEYFNVYKSLDKNLERSIKDIVKGFNTKSNSFDKEITIPVVFNVISSGEAIGSGKNLSRLRIIEQIGVLNNAYGGVYGGVDTKIKFCLAEKDIYGNSTDGINRFLGPSFFELGNGGTPCKINLTEDQRLKGYRKPGFPTSYYLNIWTTDIRFCGSIDNEGGYSSFPFVIGNDNIDDQLDGVVMHYKVVGKNDNFIPFHLGKVTVHEVGHWLGLFHTFEGDSCSSDCNNEGDMICDTEGVQGSAHYANENLCTGYNCAGQTTNAIQNYMDYAKDQCQTFFTEGQKDRMQDVLQAYRPQIYNRPSDQNNIVTCAPTSPGGGNGNSGDCGVGDYDIPLQTLHPPYHLYPWSWQNEFGGRIEVSDKWMVTIDAKADYLIIYERNGCSFNLKQSFNVDFYWSIDANEGLILSDNEIIVSSWLDDKVYIYNYNETNDQWYLKQTISNSISNSDVGYDVLKVDDFLFVLEASNTNNKFRIYRKGSTGSYYFHQNFSISGINLPSLSKVFESVNYSKIIRNGYDANELLFGLSRNSLGVLELNTANQWYLSDTIDLDFIYQDLSIRTFKASENYLYIMTSKPVGNYSPYHYLTLYSISAKHNTLKEDLTGTIDYKVQSVGTFASAKAAKITVFGDQFLVYGPSDYRDSLKFFKNNNYGNDDIMPTWITKSVDIGCFSNSDVDYEIYGNLLYVGDGDSFRIDIYDMFDILSNMQHSSDHTSDYIYNSEFYTQNRCSVPESYNSYFSDELIFGGNCSVVFDGVKRDISAKSAIILKSGVNITSNSNVSFKLKNQACNTIIPSTYGFSSNTNNEELNAIKVGSDQDIVLNPIDVIIYPIPSENGLIHIKSNNNTEIKTVTVYNMLGKLNLSSNELNYNNKNEIDLNLSRYAKGFYFVELILKDDREVMKKILIE